MNQKKMRAYPVLLLLFACPHGSMRRINEVHTHGHLCGAGPLGVWASSGRQPTLERQQLVTKKDACAFLSISFLLCSRQCSNNIMLAHAACHNLSPQGYYLYHVAFMSTSSMKMCAWLCVPSSRADSTFKRNVPSCARNMRALCITNTSGAACTICTTPMRRQPSVARSAWRCRRASLGACGAERAQPNLDSTAPGVPAHTAVINTYGAHLHLGRVCA